LLSLGKLHLEWLSSTLKSETTHCISEMTSVIADKGRIEMKQLWPIYKEWVQREHGTLCNSRKEEVSFETSGSFHFCEILVF
jgi:hypothetical protein